MSCQRTVKFHREHTFLNLQITLSVFKDITRSACNSGTLGFEFHVIDCNMVKRLAVNDVYKSGLLVGINYCISDLILAFDISCNRLGCRNRPFLLFIDFHLELVRLSKVKNLRKLPDYTCSFNQL